MEFVKNLFSLEAARYLSVSVMPLWSLYV
jgi:hypothetical protein